MVAPHPTEQKASQIPTLSLVSESRQRDCGKWIGEAVLNLNLAESNTKTDTVPDREGDRTPVYFVTQLAEHRRSTHPENDLLYGD